MADLHVSKKSIKTLLTEMQGKRFIIPDYQRPYKWDTEKCETLWNDIVNFKDELADSPETEYFLGTIVSYKNENNNNYPEIIDGQQRITSFFLLLRAFYKMLEDMPVDDQVTGLKTQVGPCIWDIDPISQKVTDQSKIHIESQVATTEDNHIFHAILQTGVCNKGTNWDNYTVNYDFFKTKCSEYASENPMQWKQLCITILNRCVVLPIECNTQETALTIFSTLNDRGLPLADSDIFKAQIYRNHKTEQDRKDFTNTWKKLTEICKRGDFSIDDIFRFYSHVLRARSNDKTKEIGLRKFYATDNYDRLKQPDLIEEILSLASFWLVVNKSIDPDDEDNYSISIDGRKYLHCLNHYPNEFWRYATSVYFLKNRKSETFSDDFSAFLKKLTCFLFAKFIDTPSINAIKDEMYNAFIAIHNENAFDRKFELKRNIFQQQLREHASARLSRALLLLDAYLNKEQADLIPGTFDIEHIFPKKWQDTNYNGWKEEDAATYLDRFGNKIVFEKRLNIQAGNGYFGKKKDKYRASGIAVVKALGEYPKSDWVKEDIDERENNFIGRITDFIEEHLN
jgi:uncharacterized protein with ParB-like and HNH nuclease domain